MSKNKDKIYTMFNNQQLEEIVVNINFKYRSYINEYFIIQIN